MINRVYGAAGAGKTQYLLNLIDQALESGIEPEQIGFISFTNVAIDEAVSRAMGRFNLPRKRFRYFRTLHSLAFLLTGATAGMIVTKEVLDEFGTLAGYSFKGCFDASGYYVGLTKDDKMMQMYTTGREYSLDDDGIYDKGELNVSKYEFDKFLARYKAFKETRGYIDFNDMIEQGANVEVIPSFKLLLVDEAQDFSPIQWQLVDRLVEKAENTYLAGDDLQGIYGWRGADVQKFIHYPANNIVLEQSHRVPRRIQHFAEKYAANFVQDKLPRVCKPRDAEGDIYYTERIDHIDFNKHKSYLILCRNSYYLTDVFDALTDLGYPAIFNGRKNFSKAVAEEAKEILEEGGCPEGFSPRFPTDKEWFFFTRAQRNNALAQILNPHIILSTIHGVKGSEADCVILYTPMGKSSYAEKYRDPDAYYRLLYVALTRARKELIILNNTGKKYRYLHRI